MSTNCQRSRRRGLSVRRVWRTALGTVWFVLSGLTHSPLGASECVEVLVPLYRYPSWFDPDTYTWDDIAAAQAEVPITAVINPADGPTEVPNSDYLVGVGDLEAAGVKMIGYVFTTFGARPIESVKADIDLWASAWQPWVTGIFFDESASSAGEVEYYGELYDYVHAQPELDLVVTNQGTTADEGYLSRPAADVVLSFENFESAWPDWSVADYASNYRRNRFSMLAHEVPDSATMVSDTALAPIRNYGYVYLTDDLLIPNPWDDLPTFWEEEVDALAAINASCSSAAGTLAAGQLRSPTGPFSAATGTQIGWLEGPAGANFELGLFERINGNWQRIASATGSTADEHLAVETEAGTFAWVVFARQGGGDYDFRWIAP